MSQSKTRPVGIVAMTAVITGALAGVLGAAVPADYKGKPWRGTAQPIPGKIAAAFYDVGGEGVAYHDVDPENRGSGTSNRGPEEKNNFRKDEGVDISYTKASHDKFTDGKALEVDQYCVGWTAAGEWLNYTVDVKAAGTYVVNLLASSNNKDAEISLSVNGVDRAGPIVLKSTGDVHRWRASNNVAEVTLEKGTQLLTLKFLKQAKGTINVQYIEFVPKPAAQ